jgi:hypothetical protein
MTLLSGVAEEDHNDLVEQEPALAPLPDRRLWTLSVIDRLAFPMFGSIGRQVRGQGPRRCQPCIRGNNHARVVVACAYPSRGRCMEVPETSEISCLLARDRV